MLLALVNPLNVAPLGFIQSAVDFSLQKLGVAEYCLERRAKLVTQEREEFGDAVRQERPKPDPDRGAGL